MGILVFCFNSSYHQHWQLMWGLLKIYSLQQRENKKWNCIFTGACTCTAKHINYHTWKPDRMWLDGKAIDSWMYIPMYVLYYEGDMWWR